MSRGYFGGDRRIGAREHRRIAEILEFRIDALSRPARDSARSRILDRARECSRRNARPPGGKPCMRAFVATETTHKGGSSEPDMNALAVMPRTSPRTCVVMTVTPVTKEAITRRNRGFGNRAVYGRRRCHNCHWRMIRSVVGRSKDMAHSQTPARPMLTLAGGCRRLWPTLQARFCRQLEPGWSYRPQHPEIDRCACTRRGSI